VWLSIDDADEQNGAMGWIPRSHAHGELLEHQTDNSDTLALNQVLDLKRAGLSEADARLNVLAAGQLSLHDVLLVHNSRQNRSTRRRAAFVMRYMPSRSVFDPERLPTGVHNSSSTNFRRPICLVGGQPLGNASYPGLLDARKSVPTKSEVRAACKRVEAMS
jgi:ectoine hydroxylase-related dioxygenase (phytanoyl-CoA dioxygenase family)